MKIKETLRKNKGITLIALVITIIVLIILAGISINLLLGDNGIIKKAQEAGRAYEDAAEKERLALENVDKFLNNLPQFAPTSITMTLNGNVEILTRENFAQHIGKIVTNYTGAPTVINGITVSNVYRLYWIDWDNKYKDGVATIYIKADMPESGICLLGQEELDGEIDPEGSLMRNLNPELYKEGTVPPEVNSDNMKCVRWMLNTNNWEGLKIQNYSSDINYVIASPSLEMMVDSYNTHYGLTNTEMDLGERTASSPRTKFVYIYPFDDYRAGYGIGPAYGNYVVNGFRSWATGYTLLPDDLIGSTYYPGDSRFCWLSSPNSMNDGCIMSLDGLWTNSYNVTYGPTIDEDWFEVDDRSICPVVSLKPTVQL